MSETIRRQAGQGKGAAGARRYGKRGFRQLGALTKAPVRAGCAARGFAETRVLTDWPAIVGDRLAGACRPLKVSYANRGLGATLEVLADGARAPEITMEAPRIIERVNGFYGYRAVSRVRVVQTAPDLGARGFTEESREFDRSRRTAPDHMGQNRAKLPSETDAALRTVSDPKLRAQLQRLAENLTRRAARATKDRSR